MPPPVSGHYAPLNIAFATKSVPMTGRTPWERDLGGSESALVFAARALAARGHHVDVFTRCGAPGVYDEVTYHDIDSLDQAASIRDWDAFISLRFPDLIAKDLRAGVRMLWCQDVVRQHPIHDTLAWADLLVFVSEWHRRTTVKARPSIGLDAEVVPNPVELSLVPSERAEDVPPLLLHLSRPERGLGPLLDLWPSIRARVPRARLAVARYRSFHEPAGSQVEAFCANMDQRVRATPGASHLGSLSKPQLYEQMSRAALMVYPADFDETSCIAAIEAQACGTPVLATRRGALPETLAPEACVLIDPQSARWKERFADAAAELLFDPERRLAMGAAGRQRAAQHSAEAIAARWEEVIVTRLQGRAARQAPAILRTLAQRGDAAAAQGTAASAPGPAVAPWPGWSQGMWKAITERLPAEGRVVVTGHSAAAAELAGRGSLQPELRPPLSEGGPAAALLDMGALLAADDRPAFLAWCASQVQPGGTVVHALPAAPGAVEGQQVHPTYHDISQWFGEQADIGWTKEANCEWGVPARCWLVSYAAGTAAMQPDSPERKRLLTRPIPSVSVCMIVKDAADTVLTTLHSVLCIADEILILDTGSTDATVQVIRQFEASSPVPVRLRQGPWPDDFSVARNASVEGAQGDWILWIDADERLIGGERLRRLLQSEHYEAYAIKQHNHVFDQGSTKVEIPFRVYRNGRGYRFYGAVHEHPERELNEPIEPWTTAQGVDILHYGYLTEPTRVHKLLKRNLALVNQDFIRYPGRKLSDVLYLRDCINLARFDMRANGAIRPDHLQCLRDAVDRFEQAYFPSRGRYYRLGREFYDQGLMLLGQGRQIVVQVGGEQAQRRVHWYRHPADAVFLAADAARQHVLSSMKEGP